jgi:GT2 family glycosyltransferase
VTDQASIAEAYNTVLDAHSSYLPDALVLLHDDLEVIDPRAEEKLLAALRQPDVALVGVVGGGASQGLAWWNDSPVGHQRINSGLIDFGQRTGYVDLLEGSLLAFSPWAIDNLRFDEVPGFHGYDEIALQVRAAGMKSYVADVDTFHHTDVGFKSPESHREWLRADERVRRKWGLGT